MELSIDELDLSTDDSLLLNIVKLEEVSSKVQNYKRLIEVNPLYVDRLKAVDMGGVNLYDMVKKRIDEFSAVSDYYRARKLLLTNSYFVSHYDDEVAPTYRDDDTKEQKEVSALIMLCSKLAKNMENVFGNNAVGPRVDHPDYLEMVRNNEDMYCLRPRACPQTVSLSWICRLSRYSIPPSKRWKLQLNSLRY